MGTRMYGDVIEVSCSGPDQFIPELMQEARERLATKLAAWAQQAVGHIGHVRLLETQPEYREFYEDYDEDGEPIGEPIGGSWIVSLGWKAPLEDEVAP